MKRKDEDITEIQWEGCLSVSALLIPICLSKFLAIPFCKICTSIEPNKLSKNAQSTSKKVSHKQIGIKEGIVYEQIQLKDSLDMHGNITTKVMIKERDGCYERFEHL